MEVEAIGHLIAAHPDGLEVEALGLFRRRGGDRLCGSLLAMGPEVEGQEEGQGQKNEENGHGGLLSLLLSAAL